MVLILSVLSLVGCGEKNPYDTVKVTGVVKVDGTPMSGVTVSFRPVIVDGMSAGGMTDADGNFVLTTGTAPFGSGAIVGEYNVVFFKSDVPEEYRTDSPEEFAEKFGDLRAAPVVHHVPEKYNSHRTSGVASVKVEKEGANHFEFLLSTK